MLPRSLLRGLATQATSTSSSTSASAVASSSSSFTPYTPASVVHLPLTPWPSSPRSTKRQNNSNTVDDQGSVAASTSQSQSTATTNNNNIIEPSYVQLPSHIFASPPRPDILHQCVVAHLASLRQGTAATKNRAQVRGSGKKIMRQKGTGKARVGTRQSPIRRGGGHAFAKRAKDWSIGLNNKVWELGVRTALSERWRRGELSIIPEPPVLGGISTRGLVQSFKQQQQQYSPSSPISPTTAATATATAAATSSWSDSKTLFLLSSIDDTFALSARNLPNVSVRLVVDIDVYSTLQGKRVVMDLEAVQLLEDWLGRDANRGEWLGAVEEEGEGDDLQFDITASLNNAPSAGEMAQLDAELQAMLRMDENSAPQDQDQTNPDGGIKRQDIVIEQEEAPVKEKRHNQEDPLKERTNDHEDKGDAIRQHMEELAQEQDKKVRSEDAPSPKDL